MTTRTPMDQTMDEMTQLQVRSILDVGCGNGEFYKLTYGIRYKGIDKSKSLIEQAKINNHSGDFEIGSILNFPDNSFDAVLFYHSKPNLKEAYRVCKKYVFVILDKPLDLVKKAQKLGFIIEQAEKMTAEKYNFIYLLSKEAI